MESQSKYESKLLHEDQSELEPVSDAEESEQLLETHVQAVVQSETIHSNLSESKSMSQTAEVESAQPEFKVGMINKLKFETDDSLTPMTEVLIAEEPKLKPKCAKICSLEIIQLKCWQNGGKRMVVDLLSHTLPGMLYQKIPFQLEVTFQLSGDEAVDLTKNSLNYYVQCFIQNRENREIVQLDNPFTGILAEGKIAYTKRLPKITLPQPSLYRLQVIVRLDGGHATPGMVELPFMQVS